MKKDVDEILLGYDIRFGPERYVNLIWDQEMRELHLLKPEISWPITVDTMMWPSVFVLNWFDSDLDRFLIEVNTIDPYSFEHDMLNLWQDKELMKEYYFKQKNNSLTDTILIAIAVKEGEDYLKLAKEQALEKEHWCPTDSPNLPKNVDFTGWIFLGYDVSDLKYSGLVNCGYTKDEKPLLQKIWANKLNEYGLLKTWEDAAQFREMTNKRVPEHAPFYVYKLFRDPNF